jgi:hypothetical protein
MQRSRAANKVHDIQIITVMLYPCTTRQNVAYFVLLYLSRDVLLEPSHAELISCTVTSKSKDYATDVSKGKAIPLQALTGPEGSRRLPDFMTIGTWRWQGCQPCAPAASTPRKHSWYSFLLEASRCCKTNCREPTRKTLAHQNYNLKSWSYPITGLDRPWGFQEAEDFRF